MVEISQMTESAVNQSIYYLCARIYIIQADVHVYVELASR